MPIRDNTRPSGARLQPGGIRGAHQNPKELVSDPDEFLLALGYASRKTAEHGQISAGVAELSSSCTLYLDTRPLFEQSESRGIIQILLSLLGSHLVNFFHGFETG